MPRAVRRAAMWRRRAARLRARPPADDAQRAAMTAAAFETLARALERCRE